MGKSYKGELASYYVDVPVRFRLSEENVHGTTPEILPAIQSANYYRSREFAGIGSSENPAENSAETRSDFRSTLYWNGHLKVGPSGETNVSFYTSDALSSFRITAEGISTGGQIGRAEQEIYTQTALAAYTAF